MLHLSEWVRKGREVLIKRLKNNIDRDSDMDRER